MKKLLALILCVMMFVSVLSTSAFANTATTVLDPDRPNWGPGLSTFVSASNANKAISHAKENIEYMYGTLAADTAVFGTIQTMDSTINDLVKGMFDGVDNGWAGITASALERNTKNYLKDVIGSGIIRYLNNHSDDFADVSWEYAAGGSKLTYTGHTNPAGAYIYTDAAGNIYAASRIPGTNNFNWQSTTGTMAQVMSGTAAWNNATNVTNTQSVKYDPIAYANTFAKAVEDAFNGKDGAANIQNIMYQMYSAKVYNDLQEDFNDLASDIRTWEGSDALLAAYHFNEGLFIPYAMMDVNDLPNAIGERIPATIFAP